MGPGTGARHQRLIVDASVLARLFGIRLLRLDAQVILSPEHVARPSRVRADGTVPSRLGRRPRASARSLGAGLADAERLIAEGAATLAGSQARALPRPRARGPSSRNGRSETH